MDWLKKKLEDKGYRISSNRALSTKARLLQQATAMLTKLSAMKSEAELDSESTNQLWWGNKPVHGDRRVAIRYGGATVPNTSVTVPNTLAAVRKAVEDFKSIIEESSDGDWRAEEERREELDKKNAGKKQPSS